MPREKETLRKVHAKGKRDVKKKMLRLQEKEISRKRHAERNGCQERDMPREQETLRKRHAKGKRDIKKRCQDFKKKRF